MSWYRDCNDRSKTGGLRDPLWLHVALGSIHTPHIRRRAPQAGANLVPEITMGAGVSHVADAGLVGSLPSWVEPDWTDLISGEWRSARAKELDSLGGQSKGGIGRDLQ